MVDRVNYIPLETTEDCLIGNRFGLVSITDDFIFMGSVPVR